MNNVPYFLQLQVGRKSGLISLYEGILVLWSELPDTAEPFGWVGVNLPLQRGKSGRNYIATPARDEDGKQIIISRSEVRARIIKARWLQSRQKK